MLGSEAEVCSDEVVVEVSDVVVTDVSVVVSGTTGVEFSKEVSVVVRFVGVEFCSKGIIVVSFVVEFSGEIEFISGVVFT
jgi:hypothetical protein